MGIIIKREIPKRKAIIGKTTLEGIKASLEKAYAEVNGVKTLDQLSADVTKYLPNGMKLEDLAVGNLFNISLLNFLLLFKTFPI